MAANTIKRAAEGSVTFRLAVGATIVTGDPVEIGELHGTALTDYNEPRADGKATVELHGINEVREYTVEAVNNAGNSAVAIGDILYYDSAATIKLNKDGTNGNFFGYALETITSGSSDTINVAPCQGGYE